MPATAYFQNQLARQRLLFASFSHEIKNPISATLPLLSILLKNLDSHQKRTPNTETIAELELCRSSLLRIQASHEKVIYLLQEFVQQAARPFAHGSIQFHPKTIDLATWLRDFVATHSESWTLIAPQTLEAKIDVLYFESVLTNLLRNASQYAPNSPVEITLRTQVSPHQTKKLVLEVRDFGPGIPEHARPQLFQPFQSFSHPQERMVSRTQSYGLGLYWVQRVLQEQGGKIELASLPAGQTGCHWICQWPLKN
jgi:signal transduction histidine kinase